MLKKMLLGFGFILAAGNFPSVVSADNLPISNFGHDGIKDWEEKKFVDQTHYSVAEKEGEQVLFANAKASASVLYLEKEISLETTPFLNWSWQVENTYGAIDEQSKEGDDYPARIYVVAKTGPFPWNTLALNYVWSSSAVKGQHWPNAYTEKAHMITLQSGDRQKQQWITEKRDVLADFKTYFDTDIKTINGIAIMTDSDNTGAEASTFYKKIFFSSE